MSRMKQHGEDLRFIITNVRSSSPAREERTSSRRGSKQRGASRSCGGCRGHHRTRLGASHLAGDTLRPATIATGDLTINLPQDWRRTFRRPRSTGAYPLMAQTGRSRPAKEFYSFRIRRIGSLPPRTTEACSVTDGTPPRMVSTPDDDPVPRTTAVRRTAEVSLASPTSSWPSMLMHPEGCHLVVDQWRRRGGLGEDKLEISDRSRCSQGISDSQGEAAASSGQARDVLVRAVHGSRQAGGK